MNLRAALLRQLTELKKDGVLHIMLRKTMLDECKGDKCEELLATFSMVVLRKLRPAIRPPNNTNLLPLILSLRKKIQRDITTRKDLNLKTVQQLRNIDKQKRTLQAEAAALQRKGLIHRPENADLLEDLVRENGMADSAWSEMIVHGTSLNNTHSTSEEEPSSYQPGPLLELGSLLHQQDAHLQEWQSYLDQLSRRASNDATQPHPVESHAAKPSRFTRHKGLRPASREGPDRHVSVLLPEHNTLLQSLDRELSTCTQPPQRGTALQIRGAATARDQLDIDEPAKTIKHKNDDSLVARNDRPPSFSRGRTNSENDTTDHSNDPMHPVQRRSDAFGSSEQSLSERTRASMARFETPKLGQSEVMTYSSQTSGEQPNTVVRAKTTSGSDRASLFERTRQSMSLLSDVLGNNSQKKPGPGGSRPGHTRSRTAIKITTQRPHLERAWSEESLASTAKEDAFDAGADYDSVFKSRPRLAMSPNLSPQRISDDLFLETALQRSMDKLSIDSSPEL